MMQQYHEAKVAAGDALLLFRMGDFYELFHEDAREAGRLLGVTVTTRDKDKGDKATPMAGFPHHQLDAYLAKILRAGRRAAVCDQVEDPRDAKGIVRRELTRIVSPGTVTDDNLLDPSSSNYLAAIAVDGKAASPGRAPLVGLAWVDVSTGRFQATATPHDRLVDALVRLGATECLVAQGAVNLVPAEVAERATVTPRSPRAFAVGPAVEALCGQFGVRSLEGLGFDTRQPSDLLALCAAGALVEYLQETQRASLDHLDRLAPCPAGSSLEIDAATWRSLEVTQTLRDGRRDGALLGVLDRTVTNLGARLVGEWLRAPLTDVAAINARLDAVGEIVQSATLGGALRESLRGVFDLERLVARVTTGRASPRDLSAVARTLAALPALKAKLSGRSSPRLVQLEGRIDLCPELRAALEAALADECPHHSREGGVIRPGYSADLDECRELMVGGKQWMARYQSSEAERAGIPSLKVGFNKVFGYFLEVTHAHQGRVPADYIRKQTLKNAERYITPELKEYEERVLTAEERALALEHELFVKLRDETAATGRRLLSTAQALAELDALAGFAELARSRDYCRPTVVAEPLLEVEQGRHPVLDVALADGAFVPNSLRVASAATVAETPPPPLGGGGAPPPSVPPTAAPSLLLITGPNMAGKSTYIRQAALLTLLAQVGSFVPAKRATIGVADRLFARVGASDDVARGQSTFMVEMTETARILNTATRRSLVILDEIGRGTSTYDGLSLAWAIVEDLHDRVGCRALFATHYHELTALAQRLPGVANRNVAVQEHDGGVVFLHQIVDGPADKSYGIHVAQLAGVPRSVHERAAEVLADLESKAQSSGASQAATAARVAPAASRRALQLTLFETRDHPLVDELRALDVDDLSPRAALELLQKWRERVAEG
ncbi:MAG: DNA mismatch repair protein MutS [Lacipirellulaceae bacterium]